ncbi:hypothetical protein [Kutzneria kofuensis]|uniref:Uncharacterized protein n=1 Tax=Kutzneria kofuensis TaxID=103725 RepID=A0A7W9NGX0_9PSEU|nr:hypothetical protein [Kutzneria kofuensis]MBB5891999.1 hypothetical protein [Kutzneria kofuensis]
MAGAVVRWIDEELARDQGRWQMRASGGAGGLVAMLHGAGLTGAVLWTVGGWLFGGLTLVAARSLRAAGRHSLP